MTNVLRVSRDGEASSVPKDPQECVCVSVCECVCVCVGVVLCLKKDASEAVTFSLIPA